MCPNISFDVQSISVKRRYSNCISSSCIINVPTNKRAFPRFILNIDKNDINTLPDSLNRNPRLKDKGMQVHLEVAECLSSFRMDVQ